MSDWVTYLIIKNLPKMDKLNVLLQELEKYHIYLYDNWTALYFINIDTEKKSDFFVFNDNKNKKNVLINYCEKLLKRLKNNIGWM